MARDTADRGWPRSGRRGSAGALPILLLAAALASSLSFVLPGGSDNGGANSRSLLRQRDFGPTDSDQLEFKMNRPGEERDGSSGLSVGKEMLVCMLAAAFAILVAISAPQPASAGLLSEFGGKQLDYDGESSRTELKNKKMKQAVSRSKVLDSAAVRAQKKALQAQREAAEREKADNAFRQLDDKKKSEEAEEKAKVEKAKSQREKLKQLLESNASRSSSNGQDSAKAAQVFSDFKSSREEQAKKDEEQARKADALRASVIKSLDERKESAKRAAEEAEAIAKRIEELAKNAREAADLARKSAELLK